MFGDIEEGKIYIFYGKMGSGKTTNAIAEVERFHRNNMPVWVNFPLVKEPRTKKDWEPQPVYFEDDPSGILSMRGGLFVIDEAYLTLNSREWANLPKKVFTAFTHVRKLHMTVIIIAQSWMRIDKSIREVTTIAREFKGGSFLGAMYNFTEYEVDELGDIIKSEPKEYASASKGFSLIGRKTYQLFDTDYMFQDTKERKTWPSAIGYKNGGATDVAPVREGESGRLASQSTPFAAGVPKSPIHGKVGRGLEAYFPPSLKTPALSRSLRVAEHIAPPTPDSPSSP